MKEFGVALLTVIIVTGAALHSIAEIYWAIFALTEWIGSVFFHKTGARERE